MGFFTALEFLTRLRFRAVPRTAMPDVARTQAWFPAVGLLIGLILVAIDRLALKALPEASVDVVLVVALAAITGGLHLDGLADAADGLFGGHDRERRLEIMRDVHPGTFGVVAVVSVLALKWAGLAGLPSQVHVEAIVLAPCLARFSMLVATAAFPYARHDGVGLSFHEQAWPLPLLAGGATAVIVSVALLGAGGVYVALFATGCGLAIGAYATRLLGGLTGDVYGATVEVSEALVLLCVAALANRGWIDALLFG